ncbi:MAG: hypothetical protein RL367_1017 [Pseudomonadota bacterium]|jgi:hypothetical protein
MTDTLPVTVTIATCGAKNLIARTACASSLLTA